MDCGLSRVRRGSGIFFAFLSWSRGALASFRMSTKLGVAVYFADGSGFVGCCCVEFEGADIVKHNITPLRDVLGACLHFLSFSSLQSYENTLIPVLQ